MSIAQKSVRSAALLVILLLVSAVSAQVRLASLWQEGTTYYYYSWTPLTGQVDTLWRFKANHDAWVDFPVLFAAGTDGHLYAAGEGGEWLRGALFSADTATGELTTLYDFNDLPNGYDPAPYLYHLGGDVFLGTTNAGGSNGTGVVYRYDAVAHSYTKLLDMPANWQGTGPSLLHTDGNLYIHSYSTIYRYDIAQNTLVPELAMTYAQGGSSVRQMSSHPDGSILIAAPGVPNTNGRIYTLQPGSGSLGTLYQFPDNSLPTAAPNEPLAVSYCAADGALYVSCHRGGPYIYGGLVRIEPGGQRTDLMYYDMQGEDLHDLHWAGNDTLLVTVNGYTPEEITYHRYVRNDTALTVLHDTTHVRLCSWPYYAGQRAYHLVGITRNHAEEQLRRFEWPVADMDTLGSLNHEYIQDITRRMAVRNDGRPVFLANSSWYRTYLMRYHPGSGVVDTIAYAERSGGLTSLMPLLQGDTLLVGTDALPGTNDWYIYTWNVVTGVRDSLFVFPEGSLPITRLTDTGNGIYYCSGYSDGVTVLFQVDLVAQAVTVAHTFTEAEGYWTNEDMLLASDGRLYGTTRHGTTFGGALFSFDPAQQQFSLLHQFNTLDGQSPRDRLYERTVNGQQVLVGFTATSPGRAYHFGLTDHALTWMTPLNTPDCDYYWWSRWVLASDDQLYSMNFFQTWQVDSAHFMRVDPTTGAVDCVQVYDITYGSGAVEMIDFTELGGGIHTAVPGAHAPGRGALSLAQDGPHVRFTWNGSEPPVNFRLVDAMGRCVLERPLNGAHSLAVPLHQLPNGLYIAHLSGPHGVLAAVKVMPAR